MHFRQIWSLLVALCVLQFTSPARASPESSDCVQVDGGSCAVDLEEELAETPAPAREVSAPVSQPRLVFFWGVGCPHCEEAKPFVAALAREFPELDVEQVEVRRDPRGGERFVTTMRELEAGAVGIPAFVVGRQYVIGFDPDTTEPQVRAIVERTFAGAPEQPEAKSVDLPLVGRVDPSAISLPAFTVLVGLADGLNPCAMWVLLVLLGILMHVRSRSRLFLFGGIFVAASGLVYFVFMTAWTHVFALVGLSRWVTIGLGVIVLLMGLVNLKELIWFKQGVSLMIPEKVKPGLYRRMRTIAKSARLPTAVVGITALALVVNLVELGCTLGLPAVYTRILTLRDPSALERYSYLALYNLAYVVPLALIVLIYGLTLHRFALNERGAKVLKAVSGVLLVTFGLLFIVAPDVLG